MKMPLLTLACLFPASLGALPFMIDQKNDSALPPSLLDSIQGVGPMGQEFTPALSRLDVVELYTADFSIQNGRGGILSVSIRDSAIRGAILGTSSPVSLPDGFEGITHFDFASVLTLVPGNRYVMEATVNEGDNWALGSPGNGISTYPGRTWIAGGRPQPGNDLWFREGLTVPEPGAAALLAAGVIGLGIFGWRR